MKIVFTALMSAVISIATVGQSSAAEEIAVLVEVKRPPSIDDARFAAEFTKAVPRYTDVPGLKRKYFTNSESHFGGIYYWTDKDAADAFFNETWHKRIEERYATNAQLTYFNVPVTTSGLAPDEHSADSVATIVKVSAPWYAPRFMLNSRMEDAVPDYQKVPGLVFKLFTIADGKKVGGIYLWDNKSSADAFYNEAWQTRILETYGEPAELQYLKSPVILVNGIQ